MAEITPSYCRLMARYTTWQNTSLVTAASTLSDADRWRNRGAFFGSIAATFNHLLWDDALWLARFEGDTKPERTIPPRLDSPEDWSEFCELRSLRDAQITTWAESVTDVSGTVQFHPGGGDTLVVKSRAACIIHFFNHQTHHRGQIHGMLTQAGAVPEPTDLPMIV